MTPFCDFGTLRVKSSREFPTRPVTSEIVNFAGSAPKIRHTFDKSRLDQFLGSRLLQVTHWLVSLTRPSRQLLGLLPRA
jgi:hypothetical protein